MEKNGKHCTKISGYLEKKGKNKMISSYKKYWFVLEGGLLLYYRSKDDYESISPCKGSINLGPPCIIKPCPSLVGVFQLQTRTATITLRAENLEEQNRWMEAIMAEIQPTKNVQKMSHFRYSIENLPSPKGQIKKSPEEPSQNSSEDIIHRLQKIGAQSYGNPIETVNKKASFRMRPAISNLAAGEDLERQITIKDPTYSEHIYEKIPLELLNNNEDNKEKDNTDKTISTKPLQDFNTLKVKSEENRPKSFIFENDNYAISIQEKIEYTSCKKSLNKAKSNIKDKKKNSKNTKQVFPPKDKAFLVENDTYASLEKNTNKELLTTISRDLNENDVSKDHIIQNVEENAYSIPYINDDNKNEVFYEDIDRYNAEYAEPCEYRLPEKVKRKKMKKYEEKSKGNTDSHKHVPKIKKRSSFINLVWKKKHKHKDDKYKDKMEDSKDVDTESIYETVPDEVVEKVSFTDSKAVQILSELQNILEHKMPILMDKISNDTSSQTNQNTMDILSETMKEIPKTTETDNTENSPDPPPLVPKTCKQELFSSPFHDVPTNNKPIPLPPKKKKIGNLKNLDDILDELNSQQLETEKNKVQKLIKKFSIPELFENEVVLRNNSRDEMKREEGDSDELNRLLTELAKVTNAPILLPGVTSSLNSNDIKNEELSKLLPVKQRRYSEPDYDIPRPHRALTITQKKDDISTNIIESTRFFGPILKPSGIINPETDTFENSLQFNSITPDSLEANINHIPWTTKQSSSSNQLHKSKERKLSSKSSLKSTDNFMIENEIYSEPRTILLKQKLDDYDPDDEVFVDSLELCKNEVATEF